ncbi:hypothetical protein [Streptomyces montanisoli]|uniref:Alanine-rich protein n=1 Tax=Streptomyces montanisoli TaxID=2798581 RepID=A0A940RYP4_9ACTN|nr:hypothetical protein [Streptomyces montanisoli]MBP0459398.1 hypothetical protein [Streptomyces montanisoli]
MRASAFLYPWDVVGDEAAAARVADLGVHQVTLASAYHSTRAVTPRHPGHRIVTAQHAAVLYPPSAERWAGRALRPRPAGAWAPGDAFGEAADALAGAGLDVHSWVVLAHDSRLGAEHPETSVVNAYGDRYPWAPCIARPEVAEYLADLAVEAAVRPGAGGTELESCGWYGLAHLHAHDKIASFASGDAEQYLMSVCFCPVCREGYARDGAGVAPEEVRAALENLAPAGAAADVVHRTMLWRGKVARAFQERVVAAVRAAAPPGFRILLHADPHPHRTGANTGVDPAHIAKVADGVVVPCAGGPEGMLEPFARAGAGVVAANFPVVGGMGGSPDTLAADAARARELGATELRLYHGGLASDGDLAQVREALRTLR